MWFIWLLIGFVFGLCVGAIYSAWVKKKLADTQAELEYLKQKYL